MLPLGKKPASPLRAGTPRYSDLRRSLVKAGITLPPYPANFGHANAYPGEQWRMLGNGPDDTVFPGFQGCGDCVWAGAAHEIMESAKTSGRVAPPFTGKTIVAQYSAYSGYDPQTGANDRGSDVQEVLAWRQTKGVYDDTGATHKIGPHVALTAGNLQEIWEAAYLFERVGIGFQFQQAQMDQFNAGKSWAYVAGSPVEGGHYVPVMGRWGLVSWARRVGFANSLITMLCDEAYAWIDMELYSKVTGKTAEGYADVDLEQYLTLVAKAKAA